MSDDYQKPQGTAVKVKNGRFTIQSNSSGEHRTFQIKTVIPDDKKPKTAFCNTMGGKRILSLLTSPENYTSFAFIDDNGVSVWSAYQGGQYPRLAYCFWRFATEGVMDAESSRVKVEGMDGYMLCEGRCCRCNRPLTVPSSVESGIGPICAEKGMF